MQKTKFALSIVSAAALLTLAACGGGGGDSGTSTQQPSNPTPPAPVITVQGSAPNVSADPLALIFVPQDAVSRGVSSHAYVTAAVAASAQAKTTAGAYTTLGANASVNVVLTSGTVADLAGNGAFALGRWTNGATSQGNVSVNQGSHYVVGTPLTVTPDLTVGAPDVKASCTLAAATQPTAVSGNFPVGKLNAATATVGLTFATLDSFSLDVAIGSDTHITSSITSAPLKGVSLGTASTPGTYLIQTLGTDAKKPFLAIGYTIPTPSSGDVSGVVVLSCQ
nr:hypothetical protein [uncultured Cupriavidus sp.]